jgi:hypothetical protein
MGTPDFLAPEQIDNAAIADARAKRQREHENGRAIRPGRRRDGSDALRNQSRQPQGTAQGQNAQLLETSVRSRSRAPKDGGGRRVARRDYRADLPRGSSCCACLKLHFRPLFTSHPEKSMLNDERAALIPYMGDHFSQIGEKKTSRRRLEWV